MFFIMVTLFITWKLIAFITPYNEQALVRWTQISWILSYQPCDLDKYASLGLSFPLCKVGKILALTVLMGCKDQRKKYKNATETMKCYTHVKLKYSVSSKLFYSLSTELVEDCMEPGSYCSHLPHEFHIRYLRAVTTICHGSGSFFFLHFYT